METHDVLVAVAFFALLIATVALVLVWDSDAQRAKRKARREVKAAEGFRAHVHGRVDMVMDAELDALLDLIDGLEDRRAEWHWLVDDLSIDVVPGTVW